MAEVNTENYEDIFPQPDLDSDHTCRRFDGKVAIVTGGASGIGRATVERFCNDGAAVAIFDLDESLGHHVKNVLLFQGKKVKFYKVDVSNKEECIAAVNRVADNNKGVVNYLVNCAGHFCFKSGLELTPEDWNKSWSVNVVGYSNMVQACYPYMKKDTNNVAIVNVCSVAAYLAMPGCPVPGWAYSSTKGAVRILTKCMALDLSDNGIRVNSVSPGIVWTPVVAREKGNRAEIEDKCRNCTLSRRSADAAEIAAAVTFLCSDDATYINGVDLPVDGGYTAMGPEGLGVKSSFAGNNS